MTIRQLASLLKKPVQEVLLGYANVCGYWQALGCSTTPIPDIHIERELDEHEVFSVISLLTGKSILEFLISISE